MKTRNQMHWTFLALAVCATIDIGAVTLAQHTGNAPFCYEHAGSAVHSQQS